MNRFIQVSREKGIQTFSTRILTSNKLMNQANSLTGHGMVFPFPSFWMFLECVLSGKKDLSGLRRITNDFLGDILQFNASHRTAQAFEIGFRQFWPEAHGRKKFGRLITPQHGDSRPCHGFEQH